MPTATGANLVVDPARRAVTVRGTSIVLTTTEFDILAALARDLGIVISREQLLDRVWGPEFVDVARESPTIE
jgi:DNA-binding response OmpR family regulator